MLAHTLGNPFKSATVQQFAQHNLWLIGVCCSERSWRETYAQGKRVGTFGDLATVSFYPAHHITMGEGGCVLTDKALLKKLVESFHDSSRTAGASRVRTIPVANGLVGSWVNSPTGMITSTPTLTSAII